MSKITLSLVLFLLLCVLSLLYPADGHGNYHGRHKKLKRSKKWVAPTRVEVTEFDSSYWINAAQSTLKSKLALPTTTRYGDNSQPAAKNVIFFIGDGMSVQTVTGARIYTGKDEKFDFAFDKLPTSGFSKTYCVDAQIPDSACTGTAYHTGVKTNFGAIGQDARAAVGNCEDAGNESYNTEAISKWAIDAGMNVGIVTTSYVTDASPSPLYASTSYRLFNTDQGFVSSGCDADKLDDIAEQMVYGDLAKQFKVILGGGRNAFRDKSFKDEEGQAGTRGDGKDLIKEWSKIHQKMGKSEFVWNRKELLKVNTKKVDYLLGLFEGQTMKFNLQNTDGGEPSLSEMMEVAIEILSRDGKGFYLFVEGGIIDYGHHFTMARAALDETKELGAALEKARAMTNSSDTLIVLSADHAHTMTINGFTARKSDILGLSDTVGDDGLPITTVSYAMGAGYKNNFNGNGFDRVDLTEQDMSDVEFRFPAGLPSDMENHAADDVPIYAVGPFNHIFSGAMEQNAIPYLMAYAAKIGPYTPAPQSSGKNKNGNNNHSKRH